MRFSAAKASDRRPCARGCSTRKQHPDAEHPIQDRRREDACRRSDFLVVTRRASSHICTPRLICSASEIPSRSRTDWSAIFISSEMWNVNVFVGDIAQTLQGLTSPVNLEGTNHDAGLVHFLRGANHSPISRGGRPRWWLPRVTVLHPEQSALESMMAFRFSCHLVTQPLLASAGSSFHLLL
jgi:hypothetical protein